MCGGAPGMEKEREAADQHLAIQAKRRIETDMQTKMPEEGGASNSGNELWRSLHLENEILVKIIHPHKLTKTIVNAQNSRQNKSVDDKPNTNANDDDDGSDEDEDKWLCEGTIKFKAGCKSGQKADAFDYYLDTERWSCPDRDCDFDLCEMCTRWCLHCEKTGNDIGWVDDKAAQDPTDI